ncbi:MAG: NAD(+) diphosphatase [Pseudomonadota bacterium]
MLHRPPILFTEAEIDRAAALRTPDHQARLTADPAARTLPIWRGKPALTEGETLSLAWLPLDAPVLSEAVEPPIFLGLRAGAPCFATDVSKWEDPTADTEALTRFLDASGNRHPSFAPGTAFRDLRASMPQLASSAAGDAATARGLTGWHATHRFCARCGAPSSPDLAGWRRRCDTCGASHFPRTDPVVIMLITSGNDVLLGRSPGWPEGMYSLLAGFMEPGETIEAAVRREVVEETGIAVGPVTYLASQPWPFPASLMIGCAGEALDREITLDPEELEDALWASRERVLAALDGSDPTLRPARQGAIARALLEGWLADSLAFPA